MADDTISRQAAIDAIDRYYKDKKYIIRSRTILSAICIDMKNTMDSLPPAQQWIPCNEKLPEGDERVLATTAWGDVTIAERVYPHIDDTYWFIHDGNTNATSDDVVAWMPLPKPCKASGRLHAEGNKENRKEN